MNLIIVSGVSGVGKSTIVKQFITQRSDQYELVRSVTTRKPRSEDEYYTFVSRKEFKILQDEGAFLETNLYQGSEEFYGTPVHEVERIIADDKIPILEIDINGKREIERKVDRYNFVPLSIFITASPTTVYKRLIARGEPMESIVTRLTASYEEIIAAQEYDSVIVNDNLEDALKDMQAVVAGINKGKRPDIRKYREELLELIQIIQKGD